MSYSLKNLHNSQVMVFDKDFDSQYAAQVLSIGKDYLNDEEPFAVVNLNTLFDKFFEWGVCLPRVKPYYAVKCNDDMVILRALAKFGCGFDCASKAEIEKALQLVSADKIIYAHTCKSPNSIRYAQRMGVNLMTFDNEEELEKIKELHPDSKLILRIYASDPTAQVNLGKKFGCESLYAPNLLKKAMQLKLSVVGISFHVGSGCNDPNAICIAIKEAKNLFEIGKNIGHDMTILDIGGGFPGNNLNCKTPFTKMAKIIRTSLDQYFPVSDEFQIMAEPGRYFATSVISIAVNIIATTKVKASRIIENGDNNEDAYMYYVNDGCFGSFNGIFTDHSFPKGNPLFDVIDDSPQQQFQSCVWGPTCDGQDKIELKKIRKMQVGEWLFYSDMGAYSQTTSSTFNGFKPSKYYYFADRVTWSRIANEEHRKVEHKNLKRRKTIQ